jgi:hypothetical protein
MVARTMAGALMALAAGAPVQAQVQAQTAAYTWTGMGTSVVDSSKCATYKLTIDVTVDGKTVKGVFHQQGRDERRFEATLDDKGLFKTKARVADGTMDVSGIITDKESRVLLDGYCKFEGKLTRK